MKIKYFLKLSNGRQPQNIKSGISQEPLIEFSSNFELKLRKPNQNEILLQMKMTLNGLSQIWNLSLGEETRMSESLSEDNLQMKTNLKY